MGLPFGNLIMIFFFGFGCVVSVDLVLNSLDTGENKRQSCGTGENLVRSGDEVFLDAITNFSDGALSPGIKDPLRDSLGSATDVDVKYPEFSGYSENNDFNGKLQIK